MYSKKVIQRFFGPTSTYGNDNIAVSTDMLFELLGNMVKKPQVVVGSTNLYFVHPIFFLKNKKEGYRVIVKKARFEISEFSRFVRPGSNEIDGNLKIIYWNGHNPLAIDCDRQIELKGYANILFSDIFAYPMLVCSSFVFSNVACDILKSTEVLEYINALKGFSLKEEHDINKIHGLFNI